MVTAFVQTLLPGLGLALAGVPFAGLLTGAILLLYIAQIGPIIVLVPTVIWLYWSGATGCATALLASTAIVGVFVGTVVLAVTYALLTEWINNKDPGQP